MSKCAPLRGRTGGKAGSCSGAAAPVVAIVDDDAAVRSALSLMLRANGYRVHVYASGAELLERLDLADADILLADYVLPAMDGLKLIDQLRKRGWPGSALLITGRYDTSLRDRARAQGVETVLEKPLEKLAVLEALKAQPRHGGPPRADS